MIKIYLDPGHGGTDPGAVANGLQEKDLVLDIAQEINRLLRRCQGVDVRMSRTTDQTVRLQQRTDDANQWGADYFLSIHINAGGGTGYEDFIYNQLSSGSDTVTMRDVMHQNIVERIGMRNRGKKTAGFHVLRASRMPALLTENGFIDHADDAVKMRDQTWIRQVAQGHVNGLVDLFQLEQQQQTGVREDEKTRTYQGNSIVDYLNAMGKNSSYQNRKKLAETHGITNYQGTAEQNLSLLNKLRANNQSQQRFVSSAATGDLNTTSVVDYLKSVGEDASFAHRSDLAQQLGIANYRGTASQNTELLMKLRRSQ
ncbi:N-acetylmuramoyl-L-alanine amidase [Amphibacillus jilinensis]|uniref:N-acetylmuramoyl-L-alanine amidase n=1 Tax=Amphibacillus jilinensis TaxID=1216008 RepID=UPI0003085029|nr:N-acetylmuramoyl-L-alanine amidase [Amphibacillus jilinensis]